MRRLARTLEAAVGLLLATGLIVAAIVTARAEPCPPNTSKCKVLTITPEEEQALTGQNGVFDIAEKGAAVVLGPVIKYFRDKIQSAPAGEIKKEEPPPPPKK